MKGSKWSIYKKRISALPPKGQLELLRELYELSPENGEYLATKLQTEEEVIDNFNAYYDRALEPFTLKGVLTKKEMAKAKKTIRTFQKACSDQDAVVDLMLFFVEEGTKFTVEFGDMFEEYYDTLEEVLAKLVSIMKAPGGRKLYNNSRRLRFQELAAMASGIGWGYGDFVRDRVADLDEYLSRQFNAT